MWSKCSKIGGLAGLGLVAWASGGAAETIHVVVDKLAFTSTQVSAHVGDVIEWANSDFVAHTGEGDIHGPEGWRRTGGPLWRAARR